MIVSLAGATRKRAAKPRLARITASSDADKEQEEALDQLTRSMINKIAHGPISELRKQASQPDGHHLCHRDPKGIPAGRIECWSLARVVLNSLLWQARWVQARV